MSIENAVRRGVRRALYEDEDLSDVDVEEGKMHDFLDVPADQDISDEYDSGEELARDLVDATDDEQEASGMIAYAANIDSEENIFDDALDAIDRIDFEESRRKKGNVVRGAVREAIREVLNEEDNYQNFFRGVMDTLNIDDPDDLTDEGKQKFFSFIDSYYDEETDEADEYNKEDLKGMIEPGHYKSDSKVPDFLEEGQKVREMARRAIRKALHEVSKH